MHRALTRCAEELGANQFDAMQNWRLQLNGDCNEDDDDEMPPMHEDFDCSMAQPQN
jgi:hypothetical protein